MSNSVGGKFNVAEQDFEVFMITGRGVRRLQLQRA